MTLWGGEKEEVRTAISLQNLKYDHDLVHLQVDSAFRVKSDGFVKQYVEKAKAIETVRFQEYFHPVTFPAYYYAAEDILLFQAPKDVCREVGKYIRSNPRDFQELELLERTVDFNKIGDYVNEFFSTWFRGISPEVRAANLSGVNIQQDPYFQEFLKRGIIKNVVIPLTHAGAEHKIMVTEHSAVVLVDDYRNSVPFELELVLEAKRHIVEKIWTPLAG
jgi:hypothetical protein